LTQPELETLTNQMFLAQAEEIGRMSSMRDKEEE
jgi:hypothetical protein